MELSKGENHSPTQSEKFTAAEVFRRGGSGGDAAEDSGDTFSVAAMTKKIQVSFVEGGEEVRANKRRVATTLNGGRKSLPVAEHGGLTKNRTDQHERDDEICRVVKLLFRRGRPVALRVLDGG